MCRRSDEDKTSRSSCLVPQVPRSCAVKLPGLLSACRQRRAGDARVPESPAEGTSASGTVSAGCRDHSARQGTTPPSSCGSATVVETGGTPPVGGPVTANPGRALAFECVDPGIRVRATADLQSRTCCVRTPKRRSSLSGDRRADVCAGHTERMVLAAPRVDRRNADTCTDAVPKLPGHLDPRERPRIPLPRRVDLRTQIRRSTSADRSRSRRGAATRSRPGASAGSSMSARRRCPASSGRSHRRWTSWSRSTIPTTTRRSRPHWRRPGYVYASDRGRAIVCSARPLARRPCARVAARAATDDVRRLLFPGLVHEENAEERARYDAVKRQLASPRPRKTATTTPTTKSDVVEGVMHRADG